MDEDLLLVSSRVVSRQFTQTQAALNIHSVLVQHARETCQESAITTDVILESELIQHIKADVTNVHGQETWPSARRGLQSTK